MERDLYQINKTKINLKLSLGRITGVQPRPWTWLKADTLQPPFWPLGLLTFFVSFDTLYLVSIARPVDSLPKSRHQGKTPGHWRFPPHTRWTWRRSSNFHTDQPDSGLKVPEASEHLILTLGWQTVATSDLSLSGVTAPEGGALLLQQRACGAVDGSVHWEKTAGRRGVGGGGGS